MDGEIAEQLASHRNMGKARPCHLVGTFSRHFIAIEMNRA